MKINEKVISIGKDEQLIINDVTQVIKTHLYEWFSQIKKSIPMSLSESLNATISKSIQNISFNKVYFLKNVYNDIIRNYIYPVDLPKLIVIKGSPELKEGDTEIKHFFKTKQCFLFVNKELLFTAYINTDEPISLNDVYNYFQDNNIEFKIIDITALTNEVNTSINKLKKRTIYSSYGMEFLITFSNLKSIERRDDYGVSASMTITADDTIKINVLFQSLFSMYKLFKSKELIKTFTSVLQHEWIHVIDMINSSKKSKFNSPNHMLGDITNKPVDSIDVSNKVYLYLTDTSEMQAHSLSIANMIVQYYQNVYEDEAVDKLKTFYKSPLKNMETVMKWTKTKIKTNEHNIISEYITLKDKKLKIEIKKEGALSKVNKEKIFKYIDGNKIWNKLVGYITEHINKIVDNYYNYMRSNKVDPVDYSTVERNLFFKDFIKRKTAEFMVYSLNRIELFDDFKNVKIIDDIFIMVADTDHILVELKYSKESNPQNIDTKGNTITIYIDYYLFYNIKDCELDYKKLLNKKKVMFETIYEEVQKLRRDLNDF